MGAGLGDAVPQMVQQRRPDDGTSAAAALRASSKLVHMEMEADTLRAERVHHPVGTFPGKCVQPTAAGETASVCVSVCMVSVCMQVCVYVCMTGIAYRTHAPPAERQPNGSAGAARSGARAWEPREGTCGPPEPLQVRTRLVRAALGAAGPAVSPPGEGGKAHYSHWRFRSVPAEVHFFLFAHLDEKVRRSRAAAP